MAVKIQFAQGLNVGNIGEALVGLASISVVAKDGNAAPGSASHYRWTWIDVPTASALVLGMITEGPVSAISFTPDVEGDYHLMVEAFSTDGSTSTSFRSGLTRSIGASSMAPRISRPTRSRSSTLSRGGWGSSASGSSRGHPRTTTSRQRSTRWPSRAGPASGARANGRCDYRWLVVRGIDWSWGALWLRPASRDVVQAAMARVLGLERIRFR